MIVAAFQAWLGAHFAMRAYACRRAAPRRFARYADHRLNAAFDIGGVLGKAINQATQSEHRVTGSCDKPEIVKLASRRVPKESVEKGKPAAR